MVNVCAGATIAVAAQSRKMTQADFHPAWS
jgi:hypothetical protein